MMNIRKGLAVAVFGLALSIFATQASAQVLTSPPPVYVSGAGPTNTSCASVGGVTNNCTIYVQNGTSFTPVLTVANASFDSLAIGPANAFTNKDASGNALHPFLLYACDTAGKTIVRFDPTVLPVTTTQLVASGSGLLFPPICGRSSATGDFYITNKSGPGVFQLIASSTQTCTQSGQPSQTVPLACVAFTANPIVASAVQIDTFSGMTGRGITQKYIGDLLVVDNADNKVLHSVYATPTPPLFTPLFSTLSSFITSNLNGPVGVANAPSLRQVFVSNTNSVGTLPTQPPVSIFDATGAPSTTTCPSGLSLPKGNKQVPDYLATAPTDNFVTPANTVITDTIYLVTNSSKAGTLLTWNTAQGDCTLISAATLGDPLSGVAVAPAPVTLTLQEIGSVANPVPTPFFFNSNLFQFTAGACTAPNTATVTAYPRSLATVNSMIGLATGPLSDPTKLHYPTTPGANLGDGGFETAYVAHNPNCPSVFPSDEGFIIGIFNFIDNSQYTNPRILDCTNPNQSSTEPQLIGGVTSCSLRDTLGVYPLGGPIPGDTGTTLHCLNGICTPNFFAVVNENAGPGTAKPGQFCGYQSPFTVPNVPPPGISGSFSASASTTVNVKFKLATASGSCKNGDFITDAIALISVARLADSAGPFQAINVQPTSSSIDLPPLFPPGNQQYSFTLNLPSVFAQGGAGTYSLTTTFLSDNTTNQTILFVLNP